VYIWWNQSLFVALKDAPWHDQLTGDPGSPASQIIAQILAERYSVA
jgi:hypothetical protein